MKKILISFLLIVVHTAYTQKNWTGAQSTDWNTAANWDTGVPSASDNVFIDACTTCPMLSNNVTVGNIILNWNSKINLNGKTLTTWLLTATGSEINANGGTIDAHRTSYYQNNTVNGNFTLKINQNGSDDYLGAQVGANTYNNDFTLDCNTGNWTTYGVANQYGDTYKGITTFKNTGSGWLMLASNPSSTVFFNENVTLINTNPNEGKIQVGAYGGKIQCGKKVEFKDLTTSPYSYITVAEGLFNDEVDIYTTTAYIAIGSQNTTVFKKKVTLHNSYNATIALGGSGNATFEKTSDLVIDPAMPMNRGQLLLQWCDFQGDATTANQTINLQLGTVPGSSVPTSFIRLGYYGYFAKHVNLRADYIEYNRVNFYGNVEIERTGATINIPSGFIGWGVCPGYCQFWGNVTYKNTYGDDWILQAYGPDEFKQKVTFYQGNHPWGGLRPSYSGNTTYEGDIEIRMPTGSYNAIVWGENGGTATLVAGKTLTIPEFGNGTLNLSNFTQLGSSTPHHFNIGGANLNISNSTFNSPLTVSTGRISLSASTFYDTRFAKYGNGIDNSWGGNTFKKKVNFKNLSTSGEIRFINQNSFITKP